MNVAIAGLGLIGGSFLEASKRAGHTATGFHHDDEADFSSADIIIVAMPPLAIEPWIRAHSRTFKDGAAVVDVCGVKRPLFEAFRNDYATRKWHFVGGHPMAGKEVGGFANATPDLFDGASMILTPHPFTGRAPLDTLEEYFRSVGFAKIVITSPEHHDEMIAFTSQLCHAISSAYIREPLAAEHDGYSAGSFRDMARVGAPDPDVWTELFMLNRDNLAAVLVRYIERLEDLREAISAGDAKRIHAALEEGVASKARLRRAEAAAGAEG